MQDEVLQKLKDRPTIIEGFPGFGMIGSIVTEFLISHLQCEKLDTHYFDELPANVAIHQGKLIEPISIYYNEHYNLIIIHSLMTGPGVEWKAADFVLDLYNKVNAQELVCIEGVGSGEASQGRTFFYTTHNERAAYLQEKGLETLQEGIIMGVTSAVLLKGKIPITCLFGEAQSSLPDNNAAATIIEALDKIFNLEVNPEPLRESAKVLEEKFKQILQQMQFATEEKDKKMLSYVG